VKSWPEAQLLLISRLLVFGKASASFPPQTHLLYLSGSFQPFSESYAGTYAERQTDRHTTHIHKDIWRPPQIQVAELPLTQLILGPLPSSGSV
jgi:hypothetical protein